jgi:hypothetical protein
VAVAVATLGDRYNVLDRVGGFPRLPIGGDNATTGSIMALVIAVIAALVGAILGGLAGMRFHRKVDRPASAAKRPREPRLAGNADGMSAHISDR